MLNLISTILAIGSLVIDEVFSIELFGNSLPLNNKYFFKVVLEVSKNGVNFSLIIIIGKIN